MRILTKTQYDAICDIVMEQKRRIEELEADLEKRKAQVKDLEERIRKKDECLNYCNEKLFERTRQVSELKKAQLSSVYGHMHIDFPATQKPENILF